MRLTVGDEDFIVLGPIPALSIIRRVRVHTVVQADAGGVQFQFQGAVCRGADPTVENLQSGLAFVDSTDQPTVAGRACRLDTVTEIFHMMEFYPGIWVREGAGWVVCRVNNGSIVAIATCVVTVEVWRWMNNKFDNAAAVGGAP